VTLSPGSHDEGEVRAHSARGPHPYVLST
jgi:hypothetical protein